MEKTFRLGFGVCFALCVLVLQLTTVRAADNEASRNPVKVLIPRIRVNAAIIPVGLLKSGAMESPVRQSDVGWFTGGQRSGEVGTMVLAGHFGTRTSAFNRIAALRVGDELFVESSDGKKIRYKVKRTKSYAATAFAEEVFVSSDDGIHLNLVTCQGWWNPFTRSYSKRLVVFTEAG